MQVMDNVLYALSEKWRKSTVNMGGLKSLGFQKPEIRAGARHLVIKEDRILLPHLGNLEMTIREVGPPPSLIKFEWGIKSQFNVQVYKEGTYRVFFTSVPDYLLAADRAWGFIDNKTVIISHIPPE